MRHKSRRLMLLSLVFAATMLTGGASTDLATCRRQRDDLSRLAVRGEELLKRADAYLEALVH